MIELLVQEETIKALKSKIRELNKKLYAKEQAIIERDFKLNEYRSRRIMQAQALLDNTDMTTREIANYIHTDISVVQKLKREKK